MPDQSLPDIPGCTGFDSAGEAMWERTALDEACSDFLRSFPDTYTSDAISTALDVLSGHNAVPGSESTVGGRLAFLSLLEQMSVEGARRRAVLSEAGWTEERAIEWARQIALAKIAEHRDVYDAMAGEAGWPADPADLSADEAGEVRLCIDCQTDPKLREAFRTALS